MHQIFPCIRPAARALDGLGPGPGRAKRRLDCKPSKPHLFIEPYRIGNRVGKNHAAPRVRGYFARNVDGVGYPVPSHPLSFMPLVRGQACNHKGWYVPVRVNAKVRLPFPRGVAKCQHHVPDDLLVAGSPVQLPHPLLLIIRGVNAKVFGKLWLAAPKVRRYVQQACLYHVKSATGHAQPRPWPFLLRPRPQAFSL